MPGYVLLRLSKASDDSEEKHEQHAGHSAAKLIKRCGASTFGHHVPSQDYIIVLMQPVAPARPIFPIDVTIEDARAAIAGCAEFKEKTEGDLVQGSLSLSEELLRFS